MRLFRPHVIAAACLAAVPAGAAPVADLLRADTVYDFSALEDGATVRFAGDYVLRLGGLVFGPNQGTVTLEMDEAGGDCRFAGTKTFTGAAGTTVNVRLKQAPNYLDGNQEIVFDGDGATFRLSAVSVFRPTWKVFAVGAASDTTLRFGDEPAAPDLRYADVRWRPDHAAHVVLDGDLTVAHLVGEAANGGVLDLNGHAVTVAGGGGVLSGTPRDEATGGVPFGAAVVGTGTVRLSGGETYRWLSAPTFDGTLDLRRASLDLADGVGLSAGCQDLRTDRAGVLSASGDLTFRTLAGEGPAGGVEIRGADVRTVRVAGRASGESVFRSRIVGNADFEKDGGDTLTLTGANAYTGATRVRGGVLRVRRPMLREGLVAYWSFDDFDEVGRDCGPSGVFGGETGVTDGGGTFGSVAGVLGNALNFTSGTWYRNYYLRIPDEAVTAANGIPCGNAPVTFSLWMRPVRGSGGEYYGVGCGSGPVNVLRRGKDGGDGTQMVLWIMNTNPAATTSPYLVWSIADWEFGGQNSVKADVPDLFDGRWHHVVASYDSRRLKLHYDGALVASLAQTKNVLTVASGQEIVLGCRESGYNATSQRRYAGGLDEVKVFDYAFTDEEAKAEYDARSDLFCDDPSELQPDPVVHWTFDDAADPGKDACGRVRLVRNDAPSAASGEPAVAEADGAFGKAFRCDVGSLKVEGGAYPKELPSGNRDFTVVQRFALVGDNGSSAFFSLGDVSGHETQLRFGYYMETGVKHLNVVTYGTGTTIQEREIDGPTTSGAGRGVWQTVAFVHRAAGTSACYVDGVLLDEFPATYDLKPQDFYLGWQPGQGAAKPSVLVDDVRIYDRALTANQVRTLLMTAGGTDGRVGPVLPETTAVTVDAGATLDLGGRGNRVASVSGSGTLKLLGASALAVSGAFDFAGRLVGDGRLTLDGATMTDCCDMGAFGGTVGLKEGGVWTVDPSADRPIVSTSAKLTLPTAATVCLPSGWTGESCVLAEAGQLIAPQDFSRWTILVGDRPRRLKLSVAGNRLLLFNGKGLCVTIR